MKYNGRIAVKLSKAITGITQIALAVLFLTIAPMMADDAMAENEALRFPDITGEMVNGKKLSMPDAFHGKPMVVIMLFDRDQQDVFDSWSKAHRELPKNIGLMEVALIGKVGGIARFFIKGGMRDMTKDNKARQARMMPFFGDADAVKSALKITDSSAVMAFLVNADGQVVWQDKGAYQGQFKTLPQEAL